MRDEEFPLKSNELMSEICILIDAGHDSDSLKKKIMNLNLLNYRVGFNRGRLWQSIKNEEIAKQECLISQNQEIVDLA